MSFPFRLVFFSATLHLGSMADADPLPISPPFFVTITGKSPRVHLRPGSDSPEIGRLVKGISTQATACIPDCFTPDAWVQLGADGFIGLDQLTLESGLAGNSVVPRAETLWYGKVGENGIRIVKQPRKKSRLISRERINREMAFFPNQDLRDRGWLERVEGGFVRARPVKMLTPSRFQGTAQPNLPMGFLVRDLRMKPPGRPGPLRRYDRVLVRNVSGSVVETDKGFLPRSSLRIISWKNPPARVPVGAKWVFVDLEQQTLTAYEGESAVYATLISSGKKAIDSETHVGLFQVEYKLAFSDMHGDPEAPYTVDRVPDVLFYNQDEGLHGAYWHDRFGLPMSHGCVNLSLADARWLFAWAPPVLPSSWVSITPRAAGLSSLWVFIQRRHGGKESLSKPRRIDGGTWPL